MTDGKIHIQGDGPFTRADVEALCELAVAAYKKGTELQAARQAPEGDRDAEARRLLHKVLTIGLNEGDPGVGFTPSKSEKRAGELSQEIAAFLRTTPAAPDALDARRCGSCRHWQQDSESEVIGVCTIGSGMQSQADIITTCEFGCVKFDAALASEPHKER